MASDLDLFECKDWALFRHERKTIAPYWAVVLAILFGIALAMLPIYGHAEPRLAVTQGNVTVTLYDDPCELGEKVTNLQFKATWQEGGRTFNGCWNARPDLEVVVAYFDDLTVALIPFRDLKRVTNA